MDKSEIIQQAQTIGTFPISILPDEDCCTLFVPKSPSTKVNNREARIAESELDINRLVDDAIKKSETLEYRLNEKPIQVNNSES